jgi:hypothetical protein
MNENQILNKEDEPILEELEAVISKNRGAFYEVGSALMQIRTAKLYRNRFKTFDAYCNTKWDIERSYANKLIGAVKVMDNLGTIGPILPKTEAQLRPLTKLNPEQQRQAWHHVVNQAGCARNISAALISKVVNDLFPRENSRKTGSTAKSAHVISPGDIEFSKKESIWAEKIIKTGFQRLSQKVHPDHEGGDNEMMIELIAVRNKLLGMFIKSSH